MFTDCNLPQHFQEFFLASDLASYEQRLPGIVHSQ
jgi:hypothetical protein